MVGNKEKAVALVIISILAVVAIDLMIVFPWEIQGPPEYSWSWAISVGDEFIFNASLETYGYDSYPPELSVVVGERIRATVLYLQNFTGDAENQFIDLIESPKVACEFVNGSTLPLDTKLTLDNLISRQFFPIGGWEYIDWLYPDSFDDVSEEVAANYYTYGTYLSQAYDQHFFFGYTSIFIDHYTR